MIWFTFLPLLALVSFVVAHDEKPRSPHEHARRQLEAQDRHLRARQCSRHLSDFTKKRKAKRALAKRAMRPLPQPKEIAGATKTLDVPPPQRTGLPPDFTCVTAPEGGEGPFYINNELVRYDLTEGQKGVQLLLDIGALDINTCEPLENIFVELWSANATGTYSSYTTKVTSTPAPGKTFPLLRNETFLRGGLPTNEHGIVELKTLHPGFYWPRSPHIHVMMHSNWEESPNGTIISHAGSVVHTGQIYFEESWNDRVYSMELYNNSKNTRIRNVDDFLFKEQLEIAPEGYNPFLELELLGEKIEDGLVGYMTLGVDLDASYPIKNPNYHNSSTDAAKAKLMPDLPVQEVSLEDIESETFLAVQVDGELVREQAA